MGIQPPPVCTHREAPWTVGRASGGLRPGSVSAGRGRLPLLVALPFAINLVANLLLTPIQFGMRNLPLAAVDILVVWGTIVWMMLAVWPHFRRAAVAQVPYFIWVSIATVLQLLIAWMNRA